jgi:excisionase family DNA binding protein
MPEPTHRSVAAVARRWNVDKRTVYRLVWSGELAAVRVAGTLRISDDAIADYELNHSTEATT